MMQTKLRGMVRPAARRRPRLRDISPSRWGLALIEAVLGYLWLVSALNKLLNPQFRPGLARVLQGQFKGNPNQWWVALTRALVLPHAQLWAAVVQVAEMLVALGYVAGVVLWLSGRFPRSRWARRLNGAVLLALLGGALLTANYYVMSGDTVPGLAPGKAFEEGLSIDGVATLLALALVMVHLLALRPRSSGPGLRAHWPGA